MKRFIGEPLFNAEAQRRRDAEKLELWLLPFLCFRMVICRGPKGPPISCFCGGGKTSFASAAKMEIRAASAPLQSHTEICGNLRKSMD